MINWDTRSHKGDRSINEDYCKVFMKDENFCFVLADGLGAHIKGEEASRHICEYIVKAFERMKSFTLDSVEELVREANASLIQYQMDNKAVGGLKTTLVLLIVTKEIILYANVGDSRIYQFKGHKKVFQSKDQSVCQKLVECGQLAVEDIRNHEDRSRLMNVMGQENPITIQVGTFLREPSVFLLCSDGLWENVLESEMEIDLHKVATPGDWLKLLEKRALQKATKEMDNCTAIALFSE